MLQAANKMVCPQCGVEMNHHADKLVYASHGEEMRTVDPSLGGWIEEFHSCPQCGGVGSRAA